MMTLGLTQLTTYFTFSFPFSLDKDPRCVPFMVDHDHSHNHDDGWIWWRFNPVCDSYHYDVDLFFLVFHLIFRGTRLQATDSSCRARFKIIQDAFVEKQRLAQRPPR